MDNYSPKISIIIPVYNDKEYLRECIESVLRQTYRCLEVVIVDDGSTDGSGEICDEYAKNDERVTVFHKDNGGPASSRECGLKASSGDYIMFVDGDDWLSPETAEVCMQAVRKYPELDCVLFSYAKEYPDHSVCMHIFDKSIHMKNRKLEYAVYRRLFGLYGKEMAHPEKMETMASCCMKLYRADCAKRGRFFDIKTIGSAEDALFNMYALAGIREAVYIDRPLYHYRKRDDSLTGSFRPQLSEQWNNLFHIMEGIIEEKQLDPAYREVLSDRIAMSITSISLNELFNKEHTAFEHIKAIRAYLQSNLYRRNCKKVSVRFMPPAWKAYVICAKLQLSLPIYLMSRAILILRKR